MTPTLSSELARSRSDAVRAMLVAQAAEATATELAPVRARPAPHRLVPRLLVGAALTATVGVTAAALLAGDPPTTILASASWTAMPQGAPPPDAPREDIEQWASKCTDLGAGGIGIEGVPAGRDGADDREVLVDRRGDITFCLDVSLGSATSDDPLIALAGLLATGGREKGLSSMWGTVYDQPFDPPVGGEVLVLGGDTRTPPPEPDRDPDVRSLEAYQLYGLAGDDVTGVDIILSNGLRITASTQNGTWGAWWPKSKGDPTGSRLDVHTADGTRTVAPDDASLDWDGQ